MRRRRRLESSRQKSRSGSGEEEEEEGNHGISWERSVLYRERRRRRRRKGTTKERLLAFCRALLYITLPHTEGHRNKRNATLRIPQSPCTIERAPSGWFRLDKTTDITTGVFSTLIYYKNSLLFLSGPFSDGFYCGHIRGISHAMRCFRRRRRLQEQQFLHGTFRATMSLGKRKESPPPPH